MKYPRYAELPDLLARKLVNKRGHPSLPLWVYNYSAGAQFLPVVEWTEAMQDCRGLILDEQGEIVARPFRKFWNYEQMLAQVPASEAFRVWEKLDGSLAIVCSYAGERVVSTRGSFESDQAVWAQRYFARKYPRFYPDDNLTYLFEIVYPGNRIVVDYGETEECFLLAVLDQQARDQWKLFEALTQFRKCRRFDGLRDFATVENDPQFAGQEGFVVQWESGFRAKVKLAEYKRLHRLITQCSTRTIWELLRGGGDTTELLDRVPQEFAVWARGAIDGLRESHRELKAWAADTFKTAPAFETRKQFAEFAKATPHPGLLFSLLDKHDISDTVWKLIEPEWATPFRSDPE